MAYAYERPDLRTLDELDRLVGAVTEELAVWRRRAQKAETELADRTITRPVTTSAPTVKGSRTEG